MRKLSPCFSSSYLIFCEIEQNAAALRGRNTKRQRKKPHVQTHRKERNMKIQRMKTNRIVNPLGFDLKTPHVSWTVTDTEAKKQLWARVEVSKSDGFADVIFDTGACKTASSLGVPVEIALEPRTRYFWRVTVMGDNGELVTSDTAWFETAKLDEPFTARVFLRALRRTPPRTCAARLRSPVKFSLPAHTSRASASTSSI